ncbi:MAG: hypothetical protein A3E83_04335 [Gammaproteobacteria bacterium RIFCSPHIGHO2_12_FULL_41_20]|nr:MAG: hypothetical protein A3E83_04335 [Gammaproteobacteria bacterium RIFCSPHIGHO2_12_FULL_41_20]
MQPRATSSSIGLFSTHNTDAMHFVGTHPIVPFPSQVDIDHDVFPNGKILNDQELTHVRQHSIDHPFTWRIRYIAKNNSSISSMLLHPIQYKLTHAVLQLPPPPAATAPLSTEEVGTASSSSTQLPLSQCYAVYWGVKRQKELGTGTFSKVKLMQNLETGEWYALKVMYTRAPMRWKANSLITQPVPQAALSDEIAALQATQQFIGQFSRQNHHKVYLGMKLAPGASVFDLLHDVSQPLITLTLAERWDIAIKMLQAIHSLHTEKHLLHRDIKSLNFNYDPCTGTLTLLDYGFAIDKQIAATTLLPAIGTLDYMAPELTPSVDSRSKCVRFTEASEVHALGFTLFEVFGFATLSSHDSEEPFSINENNATAIIGNPEVRHEIFTFLQRMQNPAPTFRPSLTEAIQFFTRKRQQLIENQSSALVTHVAIVNLNEYCQLSQPDRIAYRDCLTRKAQEVYFVDLQHQHTSQYLAIYRELTQKSLLTVKSPVFYSLAANQPLSNLLSSIREYLDQNATPLCIREYYQITRQPRKSSFELKCHPIKKNPTSQQPLQGNSLKRSQCALL